MRKFLLSFAFALIAACTICLAACGNDAETVEKPTVQVTEFVYDGTEITLLSDGEFYTVSGNKATDAGAYTATATLTDKKKYTWSDGTTDDVSISWTIKKATVAKPSATATEYTYSGEEVTVISAGSGYTVSGNKATDVGSYTATATISDTKNYTWADGTTDDVTVSWTINKATVAKPAATATEYTYSGEEVTLISAGSGYTVSGNKATDAGSYTATAALKDKTNYVWADGTTDDVVINWEITKISVPVPTVAGDLVYTGNAIAALQNSDYYTVTEGTKTDAGNYLSTVTLKDNKNYVWADGTTSVKRISWSIAKAQYDTSELVFEDATYAYDGNAHTLTIGGLPEDITATYTTNSLTDVGSIEVTATFTASSNYEQTEMKATLTITQARNTFTKGLSDLTIYDNDEEALTVVYSGNAVSIDLSAAFGQPVISYYTYADDEYTPAEAPENIGTYYVRAVVAGTVNYTGLESDYVKLVIQKATYDMSAVEYVTDYEFDGTEHTVAINNLPEGVTANVSGSSDVPCEKEVTITFTGDSENYNTIESVTKTLKVTVKVVNISTYEELQDSLLNEELNFDTLYGQFIIYRLSNDIDCENKVWTTVGTYTRPFTSNFDGNGKTIRNMKVTEDSATFVEYAGGLQMYGMFGCMAGTSSIHDVTFDNFNVIINENHTAGGNYYSFVLGRVPNEGFEAVELYNITVKNSHMNITDFDSRNKFRMGGIIAWDFSQSTKRDELHIVDCEFVYSGIPNAHGDDPTVSGTGYFGGLIGYIEGSEKSPSYVYTNCSVEGGTAIVYAPTQLPYMGGICGDILAGTSSIKMTNVTSSLDMYRFSSNPDAVLSADQGKFGLNAAGNALSTENCEYTGEFKLFNKLAENTAVGTKDAVAFNMQLPEGFSVKYYNGETQVNNISLADFGNNLSVTRTAKIMYKGELFCTIENTFTLTYNFAESTKVGENGITFNMQLPEGYTVSYSIGGTEVNGISLVDFFDENGNIKESVTVTANINHNGTLFRTLEQTFTSSYTFNFTFAATTEVGDDAVEFNMQLPAGFSVKYFKGETEVTDKQITKADFEGEETLKITAKIYYGSEKVLRTVEQEFTLVETGDTNPDNN